MIDPMEMQGQMPEGMPQEQPDMGMPQPEMGMEGQSPEMMGMPEEEPDQEDIGENLVDYALSVANLAKGLRKKKDKDGTLVLDKIGMEVHKGWEADEESRESWLKRNEEWIKLALLVRETKTFPWPRASNVKYPLLATAAMQYSARAYPALVPSDGAVVKAKAHPNDPDGQLTEKASRVAKHMSYQVMHKMPCWEEDMDKLLMTQAISGICFKKTYHNDVLGVHHSHLVYPENFCVNYWAKSLEKAYRKTEILRYNDNEYLEKVRNNEEFLEIELPPPTEDIGNNEEKRRETSGSDAPPVDKSTPHVFLAQHTFWDLDNDGYEEPYVITIHRDTKKVVRIVARWDSDGVHKNDEGKIVRIEPVEYFTAFPFIPNPDGSIYALGFGLLLGPLNESVNSVINQLIDSGTLNNMQTGFLGKGLRIKMGISTFQPGEWKVVNATGDDLHKSIFPLPTKEPSAVLMNLLQMLITSGNQLASIAEIFVGKMPGQNTPATTTQETVKQGMAVFTAIYKRVYRSLGQEFQKIYRLNRITPGIVEEANEILGEQLTQSDYDDEGSIIPGGDPTGDSESTKQMKIDAVGQMLQLGTINIQKFTEWALQAKEIPNYQQLMQQPPPPPPDPKAETEKLKQQTMQQKAAQDSQAKQQEVEAKAAIAQIEQARAAAKFEHEQNMAALASQKADMESKFELIQKVMEQHHNQRKSQQELVHKNAKAAQDAAIAKQKADAQVAAAKKGEKKPKK